MAQADPSDPFGKIDLFTAKEKPNGATSISMTPTNESDDPFGKIDLFKGPGVEPKTTATGAAVRGFAGGVAPVLAGVLPGAAAGATIGEALLPFGGGLPGAIGGGLLGAYLGAEGVQTAQNWALSKVPKLRDMLGQGEEQKRLDAEEHPVASFLGGLAPFAITMSPFSAGKKLAENATTWQRLAANPITARLFSGGVMGGMQLGQEAVSEDKVNWNRVAAATVFGLIWNKPTRIGEAISEFGAKPARFAFGLPSPSPVRPPTLSEVSEQNIGGPGVTESTFQGSEQRNPTAESAAINTASVEDSLIGPVRRPDLEITARQKEPELFTEYDNLIARRNTFRSWIDSQNEPKPFQFLELEEKRAALEKELADHVAARGGYDRGPRARQIKAQIREIDAEHGALTERGMAFKTGTAVETPDIAVARQHLIQSEIELRDLQPRIQAAYRSAAEYTGAPTVAPPPPEVAAPPAAPTPETPAGAPGAIQPAGAATPKPSGPIDEQRSFIAKDIQDKMIAAGRPAEEAELAGHLVAARYVARAARFGGSLGSAVDLYKLEGPKIIGGRVVTKEPTAPAGLPELSANPTRQELNAYLAAHGTGQVAAAPKGAVVPPVKEATEIGRAPPPATAPQPPPAAAPTEWKPTDYGTQRLERPGFKADIWKDQYGQWHWAANDFRVGMGKLIKGEKVPTEAEAKSAAIEAIEKEAAEPVAAPPAAAAAEEPLPPIIEMKKGAPRGRAALAPAKWSLVEALAKAGGIKPDPDTIAEVGRSKVLAPSFGPLFSKDARMDIDRALEFAVENGYIARPQEGQEAATIETLRQLLGVEVRTKQRQLRLGEAPPPKAVDIDEQRHRMNQALDDTLERLGHKLDDVPADWRARALEIMEKDEIHDPEVALERASWQEQQDAAETNKIKLEPKGLPGWDESIPSEPGAAPTGGAEATPRGEQPHGAEIGGPARPIGGGNREPAAIWQDFLNRRTAIRPESQTETGYNKTTTQRGAELRAPGRQAWLPGNIVDVGFVKDLLVAARNEDGSFTLLKRPDADGTSQSYNVKPQGGLISGPKVDFLDATRSLTKEPAEKADELAHLSQQDIDDFLQAARGSIRFTDGNRPIITLLRDANASTIIHELGHGWVEELMRDSQHPVAPESVRADADTVLRWLGLPDAGALTERTQKGNPTARATKAHERFATGFEQYLREGVAPSPELANVFARFKAWLMDLYKTIRGLGKEISPDIRAVFDRMLTEQPQETVIGQPRAGGPTLTEIHEADAKLTEPHEGEQVRDRVIAERDRYVEEQPPNIKAELEGAEKQASGEGAEPAGEGGAGPGGREQVVGGGGKPEPIAPGGGGGEEPGKIVKGGTDARPEGATIPGAGAEPGSATEREHPLAPGPAPDHIPRGEERTVDKAGNIRVDNVTNVEEVADAIRESGDRNADFDGARGATMGKGQMWDLATDMGLDPQTVDLDALEKHMEALLGGMKDMAPKVLAARRLLKQSAAIVADLMKRVAKSDSDDEAGELALAITRHDMIQSAVSGGTASWGRTGTAFHDISEGWDQVKDVNALLMAKTGRTLFQIKQIAKLGAELDKTNQISQFVRDSGKPSFGRMITEYWINGLISGIQTHLTYSVGNTILALEKVGPETALAAGIGALRSALGREGETVRIGEIAAGLRGIGRGFAPALQSGLEGLRTGVTTLLPGEEPNKRIMPPLSLGTGLIKAAVLNEAASFHDVMNTAYGLVRGIRNGVVAGAALQRAGGVVGAPLYGWEYSHLGAIPNFQVRGVTTVPLGDIARAPSRMIAAIHSFFRPLNYSIEISQRAFRDAANEDLTGAAFDSRVAELTSNPAIETMEAAHKMATELTLMGAGSELTRKLSGLVNTEFFGTKDVNGKTIAGTGMPILKFIDPFIHISSNIINQSIVQRTPLGILSSAVRADLLGHNGPIAADTAAAKMLAGTALSILFGSLAAEGYVTGSEPSNREDAAIWRQVYQAHSVRIGDTWYAMNRLGPMGMLLSTAADLYNVAHQADQGEFAKAAAALMHGVSQNVLDESFMRGPSDLIKAVDEPGRYGENYIKNMVASFVPFSVAMSQMARATDPYSRQARTVADAIVAKVPLLSQSLMPRRDVWGEILPSRESLGPAGLLAIWEQKMNDDPVNKALIDLGMHQGIPEKKIRNVELTPEQFDDWARLKGRLTKFRLDAIVRSPSFQNMPNHVKHDLITEQQKQAGEVARNMMFMKYPSLLVDARAAKMAKKMGPQ